MEMEDCLMKPGRKVGLVERKKPKKKMAERRDSGWAWVVAIAACLINLIIAGLGRMSGVLYVAFIERFDVTRQEATAPFSIRSSVRNLLGPVVGILGQQYGVRAVTLAGGILGTASASACFFAPNILWITIIWGGINGVCTSLTTTLPQVVIGQYFDKYRTTATGMAFSGGCVGAFVFPVLLEYLLHTYGVQGTFLIIGGVVMNVIPAAMILRRPHWLSDANNQSEADKDGVEIIVVNDDDIVTDVALNRSHIPQETKKKCISESIKNERSPDIVCDIKHVENSIVLPEESEKSLSIQCPSSVEDPTSKNEAHRGGGFKKHIITAFKLHANPMFLLISFCRAVHFLTFVPAVTVIVDFGMDKGLPEADGKFIIAALSAGDLVGRLCLGWVTDRGFITLPRYMLVVMIMQGACTACLPLLCSRGGIFTLIALFGLLQGSVFVRHPVLVSRYMGDDEQSIAMGCINFLSGLLGFSLPYFIGYFRDHLGSYDYMFYMTGSVGSIIGLLWMLEPYFSSYTKSHHLEIRT